MNDSGGLRPHYLKLALLGMLTAVFVSACGVLPRPFQPEQKTSLATGAFNLKPSASMRVAVPEGFAEEMTPLLQAELAAALQTYDIVAYSAAARAGSHRLTLTMQEPGTATARIHAPDGTLMLDRRLPAAGTSARDSASARKSPAPSTVQSARRLARHYAGLLANDIFTLDAGLAVAGDTEPGERVASSTINTGTAAPAAPLPVVSITEISGAPGDGEHSLARAMARALHAHGVPLTAPPTADSHLLAADIKMRTKGPAEELIRITWRLSRPTGEQLGQMRQENILPKGTLDGAWGEIAAAVADSGAPELVALLRRSQRQ